MEGADKYNSFLRDSSKTLPAGGSCHKEEKDKNCIPGWLKKHREILGFVLNYKTVKRVTKYDI